MTVSKTLDKYKRSSEKLSVKPLLNADLLKFIKIREKLWTVQSEWFIDSNYGLRRGFSNRKQIVENNWKHWVLGNLVDYVNTKYRKHHRNFWNDLVWLTNWSLSIETILAASTMSSMIKIWLINRKETLP